jgi:hypothetical protein
MSFLATARVFVLILLGACACLELGFRLGCWLHRRSQEQKPTVLGVALSAHLALLGFILAFTFGLAATRLGERKALVIDEANAIGTAGLRARVLPEPHATKIRQILASYAELRGVLVPEGRLSVEEAGPKNAALAKELWEETRQAVLEGKPNEPFVTAFAASVNEVIDTGTKRSTVVFRHQVPRMIWVTLGLIGVLCMLMLGYNAGIQKGWRPWVAVPLAASLAVVVTLVVELDAPLGLVRLSQEPLLATLRELRTPVSSAR